MNGIILMAMLDVASADPLTYTDALQSALDRNPEIQGSLAILEETSGALMAAEGAYDLQFSGRSTYSSMTSEAIREFGEVLSEYSAIDTGFGLTWLGTSGTSATVDMSMIRSHFRYELAGDFPITIESQDPQYQTRMAATLSQSLLEGHRESYNLRLVRSAQQALDAATLDQRVRRQQILADTATAYWSLWTATALVTIAEGSLGVAQEEQRLVHARVELGEIAPVERSRVDALVVQAETDLLEARNERASQQDALLLLIGEPLDSTVELVTSPESPVDMTLDVEALIENAIRNSPDLALAIADEEGARADVEAAQHALLPQLDLAANYAILGYETQQGAALGEMFGASLPEWSVGMNFSMPVGNRSARGNLHSARAVLTQKSIARETIERTIRQQIRTQVRILESARSRLSLEEQRQSLAEETLEAERALRDAGRSLEKNVLEAIQASTDARVAVEQARVNYLLAVIELERLQGSL